MRRIKIFVGTNKIGSTCERIIDIDEDSTEEEIQEIAWETACEMIDFNWQEVE